MQLDTLILKQTWLPVSQQIQNLSDCQLVLVFGNSELSSPDRCFLELRQRYPDAAIAGASSCGNILGDEIRNEAAVAVAIAFDTARVRLASREFDHPPHVHDLARQLCLQLQEPDLRHLLVFSDGLMINGSELADGFNHGYCGCGVSGGLAGDGKRFAKTWTMANGAPMQGQIVAVGLYGASLAIGCGSYAGWSAFGASRLVTRSIGNVLYELDHEPALALYKRYLGEFAKDLPNSGMRFPLSIHPTGTENGIIRTLLGVNEQEQSITFAGDIPTGYIARLMHPNFNRLIDGSAEAVHSAPRINTDPALALIVSCCGRMAVMDEQVEDELCVIQQSLGTSVQLTGFYSYGELGPLGSRSQRCHLHNQTVTVTSIYERS